MTSKKFLNCTKSSVIDVNVTPADSQRGVRFDSRLCPLARAIQRAVDKKFRRRHELYVVVGLGYVNLCGIPTPRSLELPPEALEFRRAFDNSELPRPKPIRFQLELEPVGAPVEVGQIRKWKGLYHGHKAEGLIFQVTEVEPNGQVVGRYLRRSSEGVSLTKTYARSDWKTYARSDWMAQQSTVIG